MPEVMAQTYLHPMETIEGQLNIAETAHYKNLLELIYKNL